MSSPIVGLISDPEGVQYVLVFGDGVLSIFMEAFATGPAEVPTVAEIDAWMSEQNQRGAETASIISTLPMPVSVFVQHVKVKGVPRVRPELRGMAQEPWSSVLRAMWVKLDGRQSTLPPGYAFRPALTVALVRHAAAC